MKNKSDVYSQSDKVFNEQVVQIISGFGRDDRPEQVRATATRKEPEQKKAPNKEEDMNEITNAAESEAEITGEETVALEQAEVTEGAAGDKEEAEEAEEKEEKGEKGEKGDRKEAYDRVRIARDNSRPTGVDYIRRLFGGFLELHGDRRYEDDAAIVGGVAFLEDRPVTVIAIEKGHTTKERMQRSFGAPHPEGYRKALRLMKQAEKFRRPVVCLVDTSGAYCGIGAEERGQGQAIAENLMEMMTLKTPVISIFIGEGGSGGALALAVADRVWMLENAIYSVISPEGCASILYKDSSRAAEAAEQLKLTAQDSLENGLIERVIEENFEDRDFYNNLKEDIIKEFDELEKLNTEELLDARYNRFRRIGEDLCAE